MISHEITLFCIIMSWLLDCPSFLFRTIPGNAFFGTNVTRLYLQRNKISTLEISAFSLLPYLDELRLDENVLASIPVDAFPPRLTQPPHRQRSFRLALVTKKRGIDNHRVEGPA